MLPKQTREVLAASGMPLWGRLLLQTGFFAVMSLCFAWTLLVILVCYLWVLLASAVRRREEGGRAYPTTDLPPAHGMAQRPLGCVVRRLDPLYPRERVQGGFDAEQLSAHSGCCCAPAPGTAVE